MMATSALHTSDRRKLDRMWQRLGGTISPVRRTGENRYSHPAFQSTVRTNARRCDVPAKLLSRINQLIASENDRSDLNGNYERERGYSHLI